jgi:Holliday junction DNA helicase RuvB
MARAVAAEYGADLYTILSSGDTKPSEICAVLREVKHGDVVLGDEGHSLSRDAQQVLYTALDEWRVPAEVKRGISRSEFESIAQFTLILATNEPGGIKHALRSRLTRIEFDAYSQRELKAIAERVAEAEEISFSPQAANLLAKTSQGSPRSIRRRVHNLRHFWSDVAHLTKDHVHAYLTSEGIDELGFTPHQRVYLESLAAMPKGQSNIERLAVRLGCDAANVRQEIEPYLIEQGFVDPASRLGRSITTQGLEVVDGIKQEANEREDTDDD